MVSDSAKKDIMWVAERLKAARRLLFITGAGISADSGLPTYRGIGGLYNDRTTEDGIPIEMALAGEMLERKPEVTWKYLSQIEKNCRQATFNRAHEVIAQLERRFERVVVLTQNIDGFHIDAGSHAVIEIHGNMHHMRCMSCEWHIRLKDFSEIDIPPHCPRCNHIVRPDVVFFGEMLPVDKVTALSSELERGFDMYFSVGTTSVFPYIQQPILDAVRKGLPTVEINPARTEVSDVVDVQIPLGASEALDAIFREL